MKTVYIVSGQTGEYSDHREWLVAAYLDESKAMTHVELANARARELDERKTGATDTLIIPGGNFPSGYVFQIQAVKVYDSGTTATPIIIYL
jgi:hypothetical protein